MSGAGGMAAKLRAYHEGMLPPAVAAVSDRRRRSEIDATTCVYAHAEEQRTSYPEMLQKIKVDNDKKRIYSESLCY